MTPRAVPVVDRSDAVCVVGAGPAGLSVARALRRLGLPYEQFERHTDVGGIWDIDNPGTPMYESAHFISSRDRSGFYDFPMPPTFADYPGRRDVLRYTRDFADAFGLRDALTCGAAVRGVTADGDGWLVDVEGHGVRRYRGVVCASGATWHPRVPDHPGTFTGEIRHAVDYRSPELFRDRRVLVVGLGNSGADIACDAATVAADVMVSVRRGYHLLPKHLFGIPADEFAARGPHLPLWLRRPIFQLMLRALVGDLTRWGLPAPSHRLFESHPLLNTQLLHHLQHGDVRVKADVVAFSGPDVLFADGTRERPDLVLYATGYDMTIPYLPEEYLSWRAGRPQQYLTAFSRTRRNLFTLGFLEANTSAYTLFDHISNVVVQYLRDQTERPAAAAAFDRLARTAAPDLSGGLHFVDSPRHTGYLDADTYRAELARLRRRFGWTDLAPGMFDGIRVGDPRPATIDRA